MKIKCIKNVCASGVSLEAGKTYDISNSDATITVDDVAYTVRELRKLDDGIFCEISIQKT
jgi:hypothetical protein